MILIASSEGTKAFCFNTIVPPGNFPETSVEEARSIAIELSLCIRKGILSLKKSDGSIKITFKGLFDKYIREHCMHNNKGWKEIIATMNLYGKHFYKMQIFTIT